MNQLNQFVESKISLFLRTDKEMESLLLNLCHTHYINIY